MDLSPALLRDKRLWILEDDPSARFIYEEVLELRYQLLFFLNFGLFYKRTLV
jgi:hypothetical protein